MSVAPGKRQANSGAEAPVVHALIARGQLGGTGIDALQECSPHLNSQNSASFLKALRRDLSLMSVQRARRTSGSSAPTEPYPVPEVCLPYLEANSLGFELRSLLPLVFVRSAKGELLPEARVALMYLRENSRRFSSVLDEIEAHARTLFVEEMYEDLRTTDPLLVADLVQPYSTFSGLHLSLPTGMWVKTPRGISTVLAPPVNRKAPLSILTGVVETDWHHLTLFLVAELPQFEGPVMMVPPSQALAQTYFVERDLFGTCEITLSPHEGGDPTYVAEWERAVDDLLSRGEVRTTQMTGVSSVRVDCAHCSGSVTAAVDQALPKTHVHRRKFHRAYKLLRSRRQ